MLSILHYADGLRNAVGFVTIGDWILINDMGSDQAKGIHRAGAEDTPNDEINAVRHYIPTVKRDEDWVEYPPPAPPMHPPTPPSPPP